GIGLFPRRGGQRLGAGSSTRITVMIGLRPHRRAGPHQRQAPTDAGPAEQQVEHDDGELLVVIAEAADDRGEELEEKTDAACDECYPGVHTFSITSSVPGVCCRSGAASASGMQGISTRHPSTTA